MNITTDNQPEFLVVSYLRRVWKDREGAVKLAQDRITETEIYPDFDAFVAGFWPTATYPKAQSAKFETYGWTPTFFERSTKRRTKDPASDLIEGHFRVGSAACGEHSLFYLDLDNQHDDRDFVTFDDLAEVLTGLGLSHALYTSFSHTDDRHKVRVVLPVSRHITYDEARRLFVWFNEALGGQFDASIYDPGDFLYGPTHEGRTQAWTGGSNLDVDNVLALSDALPEAVLASYAPVKRTAIIRDLTETEIANWRGLTADTSVRGEVRIDNPRIVRPEWREELARCAHGGSHRQTLMSVLTKVWKRSGATLTRGELSELQRDMDAEDMCGYVLRKYGRHAMMDDVAAVMRLPAEDRRETKDNWVARRLAAKTAQRQQRTEDRPMGP